MKASENLIVDKSFQFAIDIIAFTDILEGQRKYTVAKQLTKSGTSIGANVHEAQSPESKNDFVHKLKIAAKEACETKYWLLVCQKCPTLPDPGDLLTKVESIQRILSSIIATCKNRYTK